MRSVRTEARSRPDQPMRDTCSDLDAVLRRGSEYFRLRDDWPVTNGERIALEQT
jgi:hypothetical protein